MQNKTEEEQEIIQEYIDFLSSQNCLLNCSDESIACFSDYSFEFETSDNVSILNIKLENNDSSQILHNLKQFCLDIRVKNISIEDTCESSLLYNYLDILKDTYVNNVELYVSYTQFKDCDYEEFLFNYPFLSKIVLLGANEDSVEYLESGKHISIQKTQSIKVDSEEKSIQFILNKKFFFESQSYNTFYNKRLFINDSGEIKTHPKALQEIKIDSFSLLDIKENIGDIGKNIIQSCKECEHRHLCYDSRVPEYKNRKWEYVTECNYNPYIAKWAMEEGYISMKEYLLNIKI
ncbi:hypothetical protein LJC16_00055 [Bacteroidales bacterium OttesenSCG-928-C19]|nr:hypothetical protein [Bacteroidales bacterium OttesenSCG-928-C19]